MDALLNASGLLKIYPPLGAGAVGLELFRQLDLRVARGEMLAIVGESGTGKSTLLHLLALLDRPSAGAVRLDGRDATGLGAKAAALFRNQEIGYVWQFHSLLPEFTAVENVALPLRARGVSRKIALAEAATWVARVGLADRAEHRSGELSGGEQQRIAIARALVTRPKLLLADEPTGDLDDATAERIFGLLEELHREGGLTTILVTHNLGYARRCDRVLRLSGGKLAPFESA